MTAMKAKLPLVRLRVMDIEGKFLRRATAIAVSSMGERTEFDRATDQNVFAGYLKPGTYSVEVRAKGLEPMVREIDVSDQGASETFVVGRPGLPYYYQGRVKVPFEHSDLYAVALRLSDRDTGFIELARQNGVDLAGFGVEEVRVTEEVKRQGVQAFKVTPEMGAAFETRARAQPFVRSAGPVVRVSTRGISFLTDEFICYMKPGAALHPDARQGGLTPRALRETAGGWIVRANDTRSSMDLLEICNGIAASDDVLWAEPNLFSTVFRHTADATSLTPAELSNLNDNQPHHELIRTVDTAAGNGAWQLATGAGAVIAIIDGGCDVGHQDFNIPGKVLQTCNFAASPADSNINTLSIHGTRCAGIAAGATDALFGHSGVAPDAGLVIVEMAGDTVSRTVDMFLWCAGKLTDRSDLPAKTAFIDVVSCSWDYDTLMLSEDMKNAFDALDQANCVVVFSSGNFGTDFSGQAYSELARYDKNIAVGSSTLSPPYQRAADSSFGKDLDLVAPGGGDGEVTGTTDPGGHYGSFSQTSCACPQVAGVVALMQSARRIKSKTDLTAQNIRDILAQTTIEIPNSTAYAANGRDDFCGFGQIDARAAVVQALVVP